MKVCCFHSMRGKKSVTKQKCVYQKELMRSREKCEYQKYEVS